jgi:hypothetical protein
MYNSRECSGLHRTYYNKYPTIPNSFLHQLATFLKLPARLPEAAITRKMQIGMAISLHDREQEAEHINGACMVCRTEVLRQVGGSDGRFPLFLEETDLCMRVREAGWKIRYTPRAEIIHLGSQSLILLGKSKEFHYASNFFGKALRQAACSLVQDGGETSGANRAAPVKPGVQILTWCVSAVDAAANSRTSSRMVSR